MGDSKRSSAIAEMMGMGYTQDAATYAVDQSGLTDALLITSWLSIHPYTPAAAPPRPPNNGGGLMAQLMQQRQQSQTLQTQQPSPSSSTPSSGLMAQLIQQRQRLQTLPTPIQQSSLPPSGGLMAQLIQQRQQSLSSTRLQTLPSPQAPLPSPQAPLPSSPSPSSLSFVSRLIQQQPPPPPSTTITTMTTTTTKPAVDESKKVALPTKHGTGILMRFDNKKPIPPNVPATVVDLTVGDDVTDLTTTTTTSSSTSIVKKEIIDLGDSSDSDEDAPITVDDESSSSDSDNDEKKESKEEIAKQKKETPLPLLGGAVPWRKLDETQGYTILGTPRRLTKLERKGAGLKEDDISTFKDAYLLSLFKNAVAPLDERVKQDLIVNKSASRPVYRGERELTYTTEAIYRQFAAEYATFHTKRNVYMVEDIWRPAMRYDASVVEDKTYTPMPSYWKCSNLTYIDEHFYRKWAATYHRHLGVVDKKPAKIPEANGEIKAKKEWKKYELHVESDWHYLHNEPVVQLRNFYLDSLTDSVAAVNAWTKWVNEYINGGGTALIPAAVRRLLVSWELIPLNLKVDPFVNNGDMIWDADVVSTTGTKTDWERLFRNDNGIFMLVWTEAIALNRVWYKPPVVEAIRTRGRKKTTNEEESELVNDLDEDVKQSILKMKKDLDALVPTVHRKASYKSMKNKALIAFLDARFAENPSLTQFTVSVQDQLDAIVVNTQLQMAEDEKVEPASSKPLSNKELEAAQEEREKAYIQRDKRQLLVDLVIRFEDSIEPNWFRYLEDTVDDEGTVRFKSYGEADSFAHTMTAGKVEGGIVVMRFNPQFTDIEKRLPMPTYFIYTISSSYWHEYYYKVWYKHYSDASIGRVKATTTDSKTSSWPGTLVVGSYTDWITNEEVSKLFDYITTSTWDYESAVVNYSAWLMDYSKRLSVTTDTLLGQLQQWGLLPRGGGNTSKFEFSVDEHNRNGNNNTIDWNRYFKPQYDDDTISYVGRSRGYQRDLDDIARTYSDKDNTTGLSSVAPAPYEGQMPKIDTVQYYSDLRIKSESLYSRLQRMANTEDMKAERKVKSRTTKKKTDATSVLMDKIKANQERAKLKRGNTDSKSGAAATSDTPSENVVADKKGKRTTKDGSVVSNATRISIGAKINTMKLRRA